MPQLMRTKNADPAAYLRRLFQKTENDIIDEILRKHRGGYVDYAEQAALKRIQEDLQNMIDESFVYVPRMIEKNFYGPKSGYTNAEKIAGTTNRVMMETLADNLLGEIVEAAGKAATTAGALYIIARLDNDELRKAALESTAYAEALGKGAYTSSELMEAALRNKGVTAFVDKSGRRWSLTDYCNMASRTTARQAEVAGVLSADEHDLYQIGKIGSTCPVCAVYEGRV
ncbi:MAG: minor capsid protein, partial [Lachnospiraceae bacterium]|nr:minor capsid protein [Lachnospiraceae bacterium]